MKRILLLFFLTFPFLSSWAIADWKPIADGLYADLANQKTPADSVRVLYNIFDLVPRAQQGDVARQLYDSAQRAGMPEVQLDVLRLLTSLYSSADHVLDIIEKEAGKLPDSREKEETLVFIRMRRLTKSSKYASEKERHDDISRVLASYETEKNKTPQQEFLQLYTLVEYLRNDVDSKNLIKYLDKLMKFLGNNPFKLYAIHNIVYTEVANIYSDAGEAERAVEADRKLLKICDMLQESYKKKGRIYHDMSTSKYVALRRMIRNYKALTPEQIANANAEVEKLASINPDIRDDIDRLPRYRAHYYMATGRYAEAIPMIKAHIADEKALPNRRQLYDMLAEAARNTGDSATLVTALSEYNKILAELNAISSSQKYRELQIRYDVDSLTKDKLALELKARESEVHSTRKMMAVVSSGWALFFILLIVLLFYWSRYRANAAHLRMAMESFAAERDRLRDFRYYDYASPSENIAAEDKRIPAFHKKNYRSGASQMMESIITDLLYIASIGRTEHEKAISDFSVDEMMRRAVTKASPMVEDAVKLNVIYPEEDFKIQTDFECASYVLGRLLENAARFTVRGEITLTCRRDSQYDYVKFTITDTGLRIAPGEEESVFHDFINLTDLTDNDHAGSFICRMIHFLLSGTIKCDHNYKYGSKVILTIPLRVSK